jgi:hypothetical protein
VLGQSQATKIVLPMELTELIKPIVGYAKDSMK